MVLPGRAEMVREIAKEQAAMRKRYVASKRHTIQVDFYPYLSQLRQERERRAPVSSASPPGGAGPRDRELQAV